jgi:CheY-like chemotaxis protein
LLAEDLAVNQKLMQEMLANFGYHVDIVSNGLEVLTALERKTYDVVLMDIQMPQMDGLEASRQVVTRWPEATRPRLVALTANAMQEDRVACVDAGMDDYLAKPVRAAELKATLVRCGQWMQERHSRADASSTSPSVIAPSPTTEAASAAGVEKPLDAELDAEIVAQLRQMQDAAGPGMSEQLLEAFRSDSLPLLVSLQQAVDEEDGVKLMTAAHALKGVAANLGGQELATICSELERKGCEGSLEGAAPLAKQAEPEFHRLYAGLQKALGGELR